MPKHLILFFLTAFLVGSCAPAPASPTLPPTRTVSPTVAPSSTPEPTLIPTETTGQKHERLAEQAVALGWNLNDETTWGIPEGTTNAQELQRIIDIDIDPVAHVEAQSERDAVLAAMWQLRYEQLLINEGSATARDALADYLRSGFNTTGYSAEQLGSMTQEELHKLIRELDDTQMENLEMYRAGKSHEAMKPLYEGLLADNNAVRDRMATANGQEPAVNLYFRPKFENGSIKGGMYGFWPNSAAEPGAYNQWADKDFNMNILGHSAEWRGDLANELVYADFRVVLVMPYNITAVRSSINDSEAQPVRFNFVVVTDDQPAMEFSAGDYQHGWTNGSYDPADLSVSLRTRERTGSQNIGTFNWLTRQRLIDLEPGTLIEIRTPNEHKVHKNNRNITQTMFFDKKTGLLVFGSSGGLDANTISGASSIQFYFPGNPQP